VRPRLLLPQRLLQLLDRDSLRLLFLHELAHIKRGDILVNWLATMVHVVHWFNPLVAMAMARMRADREMATDALVLSLGDGTDRRRYGETLIRLLELGSAREALPGAVGVLEDKAELKERVTMIAEHGRNAQRWPALAGALILGLAATTLTGAVEVTNALAKAPPPGMAMLRGSVKTCTDGKPVRGASLVVAGESTGVEHVATSTRKGTYVFGVLPPGTHVIRVEAAGMKTVSRDVRVSEDSRVVVNFCLTKSE
jgi:bla regulator protein BlaR1